MQPPIYEGEANTTIDKSKQSQILKHLDSRIYAVGERLNPG